MKSQFKITNQALITDILNNSKYGTLALCSKNKPYSIPLNFVCVNNDIYFHGAIKGKKMKILKENAFASFSVVEDFSMIQSYFSSTDNLACPSTQFFKSVCIDGEIKIIDDYKEKILALQSLMEKLQKEGKHKHLSDEVYTKMINATSVFKLVPTSTNGKIKLGQHLSDKRFDMIIEHLQNRGTTIDMLTIEQMKENR